MAYLAPSEFVTKMVDGGESKIFMSTRDTMIRAYMAGAILALAAWFAVTMSINTGQPIIGAILLSTTQQLLTVTISSEVNVLVLGVMLVLFVVGAPEGIIGLIRKLFRHRNEGGE